MNEVIDAKIMTENEDVDDEEKVRNDIIIGIIK